MSVRKPARFWGMVFSTVVFGFFANGDAYGALVRGDYEGRVEIDTTGTNLIGSTWRVELTYDDSVSGIGAMGVYKFEQPLRSLVVTVGTHQWNWNPAIGTSSITLRDIGVDNFSLTAVGLAGDDLSSFPPSPIYFSFDLWDDAPFGDPDGVEDSSRLPGIAPDPDRFSYPASGKSLVIQFTSSGGLLLTQNFSATPVPLPPAVFLLVSGFGVFAFRGRFSKRNS